MATGDPAEGDSDQARYVSRLMRSAGFGLVLARVRPTTRGVTRDTASPGLRTDPERPPTT